jgi:hypothetical protein
MHRVRGEFGDGSEMKCQNLLIYSVKDNSVVETTIKMATQNPPPECLFVAGLLVVVQTVDGSGQRAQRGHSGDGVAVGPVGKNNK